MLGAGQINSGLDIPTVLFVAVCIAVLLGVFLIVAWLQDRSIRALAWWGAAYLIGGSSIALSSAPAPLVPVPPEILGALTFIACGMVWTGLRLFHGRRVLPLAIFSGALIWLVMSSIPGIAESEGGRGILAALIVAAYTFFIARELGSERRKSVYSRTAAITVPILHATIFLLPIAIKTLMPQEIAQSWFEVFALETMIYAIGTAFIVLLIVKDRGIQIHRHAASTDFLTGVFNRRAFLEHARRLCAHEAKRDAPVTVLMMDLDRFKSINDRFGHHVGDEAIKLFAATIAAQMRTDDIIGRIGGEEFAAIVPGDAEVAKKIAERVRAGFEKAGVLIAGNAIGATVSIGAACAPAAEGALDALLGRADLALYRAKSEGRNRVCMAEDAPPDPVAQLIAGARAEAARIRARHAAAQTAGGGVKTAVAAGQQAPATLRLR